MFCRLVCILGQAFADLNFALAWCEDRLLAKTNLNQNAGLAGFEPWLQHQLGAIVRAADLVAYLERKDTTLFTLTRANFQRMRRERPDLASAFDDFILRILADRIDFANHAIDALNR